MFHGPLIVPHAAGPLQPNSPRLAEPRGGHSSQGRRPTSGESDTLLGARGKLPNETNGRRKETTREPKKQQKGPVSFGCGSKNRNSKMACPGKWKHGPKPAVCPSCLILSHTHLVKCVFSFFEGTRTLVVPFLGVASRAGVSMDPPFQLTGPEKLCEPCHRLYFAKNEQGNR